MAVTDWLVDKSALVRLTSSPDANIWVERIDRGLVHVTSLTLLEIGYSARSAAELRDDMARPPLALMPVDYLTPAIEQRAIEVQALLADRGQHRAASIPDLLIAATAEMTGAIVLHVDKDYELIAGMTRQPTERLRLN